MRRVLITGCSSGIGRATAILLAERGDEVVATARHAETLDGLDVHMRLALDVDDDRSVVDAVDTAGPLDVLINNAAWGVVGPIETVPLAPVRAMFETNVFGVLRMVQAVAPGMRARGAGTIVNVSSVAGRSSTALNGPYAATKHAVEAISEAMHYELGRFGIRTVVVEPGYTASSWSANEKWMGVDDPPWDELYEAVAAHDRAGQEDAVGPDVVAETIVTAIDSGEPRLRWPAGPNAELALQVRAQVDDEEWERIVRDFTGLDW